MGRDLQRVSQYQLTNDIVKNHYVFDIKDGALKVLMILSTHYPEIYVQRKSLIKRYKIAEKTVDRALKELAEKRYINRQNDGQISLNLAVIYGQIDGEKVVNLAVPCNNQHDRTKKNNQHGKNNSQNDCLSVVSLLKGLKISEIEAKKLINTYSAETVEMYAKYVQMKKAENPQGYLLWCLREKPVIKDNQLANLKNKYTNDAQRYAAYMTAKSYNWLNSVQHAQIFLENTSKFDLRSDNILKDCIAIMLHWKFNISDYNALTLIDNVAAQNEEFRQKTVNLTAQVIEDLKNAKAITDFASQAKEIAC